jgi:hypothetical protein
VVLAALERKIFFNSFEAAYRHVDVLKVALLLLRSVVKVPFFGRSVPGQFLVAFRSLKRKSFVLVTHFNIKLNNEYKM